MTDDTSVASDRSETTPSPVPTGTGGSREPGSGERAGDTGSSSGSQGETDQRSSGSGRRRRRGGRGRGRSKAAGSGTGTGAGTASAAGPSSEGEADDRADAASTARARKQPARKPADAGGDQQGTEASTEGAPTGQRRRRRRGGRGRGGAKPTTTTGSTSFDGEAGSETTAEPRAGSTPGEGGASTTRTRRRRRKPATTSRPSGDGTDVASADAEEPSLDDPPAAIAADEAKERSKSRRRRRSGSKARTEEPAAGGSRTKSGAKSAAKSRSKSKAKSGAAAGAKSGAKSGAKKGTKGVGTAGPTRLRRGRASTRTRAPRRRRQELIIPPRITDKQMVITEHGDRDQIAILEDRDLVQHYVTRAGARSMVGNVYLGRVQNVLPGMEAAFVDVGKGRNAVLYAGEVNYSPEELDGDTPPRIEEVLKAGQSVLVQVTKDPMGGKGARLTAQISMPGRFLVMVPNSNVFGISRRINDEDRKRLKAVAKKVKPSEHGLIIRTAAEKATEEQLTADLKRVVDAWTAIEKRSKRAKAPDLLYEEPELTVRVVRDLFTDEEYKELVTDSEAVYDKVNGYLTDVAPDLAAKVRMHEGKLSAFEEYHVTEQILKALDRKVWLPSGGYLIIERTEAMTVIDVNTGKSVGKTNLEETVVNTNLEAAAEVARQLRLRDIGGIIIVDFIDMLLEKNKNKVVDTLRETMALDKTRSQVYEIGPLGLLEVTRKRVSGGLVESFSETCPTCEGRGILINYDVD